MLSKTGELASQSFCHEDLAGMQWGCCAGMLAAGRAPADRFAALRDRIRLKQRLGEMVPTLEYQETG